MNYNLSWILFLMLQFTIVILHPVHNQRGADIDHIGKISPAEDTIPKQEGAFHHQNERVISVRITSSVAVGRTKDKTQTNLKNNGKSVTHESNVTPTSEPIDISEYSKNKMTDIPPDLAGANIEFIKQLNAKKEAKEHNLENIHPFKLVINNQRYNTDDEILEESTSLYDDIDEVENLENVPLERKIPSSVNANHVSEKSEPPQPQDSNESYVIKHDEKIEKNYRINNDTIKDIQNGKRKLDISNISKDRQSDSRVPADEESENFKIDDELYIGDNYEDNNSNQTFDSTAESSLKSVIEVTTKLIDDADAEPQVEQVVSSNQNYLQEFRNKPLNGRGNIPRLTTVSFNIVHDNVKGAENYDEQTTYRNPTHSLAQPVQNYEQPKIYSEPARIYSEPAKFYSEPAKIYSEPAKIYSEPAKIYSEPAKIYSEPAKFYSEPASLHLSPSATPNFTPWQHYSQSAGTTTINTTPVTMITNPSMSRSMPKVDLEPEKNYEVDEKLSIVTNGRSHGVQESTTEKCKQDNCKVGYVVEGRQYKKYRVEERTSDGFIVGEYGVVRNEDGALRGVRYTADSDASPRLIYDALMKFLQLR
ncbi:hypothetical protein O3G_MSEX008998 [Manduca sexta]|uniref:Uncharacterized protein n=1 Tax=Manduca sexta TaxID=7130 RepID=A0A921ZDY1_MANSE|nr:hypothetical protein O3G_MSEX008998 [Manduca sexta]